LRCAGNGEHDGTGHCGQRTQSGEEFHADLARFAVVAPVEWDDIPARFSADSGELDCAPVCGIGGMSATRFARSMINAVSNALAVVYSASAKPESIFCTSGCKEMFFRRVGFSAFSAGGFLFMANPF